MAGFYRVVSHTFQSGAKELIFQITWRSGSNVNFSKKLPFEKLSYGEVLAANPLETTFSSEILLLV